MPKSKMTIEDLAKKMDKGFKDVNSRIGSVEKNVNSRIGSVKDDLSEKIGEETEFLARITQNGFKEAERKHKFAHRKIREKIKDAESNNNEIDRIVRAKVTRDDRQDARIKDIKTRVKILEKQTL